ncbi:MAG: hypothetical protein ACI396_02005, partial [Acutalibacteraceae bacterium]
MIYSAACTSNKYLIGENTYFAYFQERRGGIGGERAQPKIFDFCERNPLQKRVMTRAILSDFRQAFLCDLCNFFGEMGFGKEILLSYRANQNFSGNPLIGFPTPKQFTEL